MLKYLFSVTLCKVIYIFAVKYCLVYFDKVVQSSTDIVEHCSASLIHPSGQCCFLRKRILISNKHSTTLEESKTSLMTDNKKQ